MGATGARREAGALRRGPLQGRFRNETWHALLLCLPVWGADCRTGTGPEGPYRVCPTLAPGSAGLAGAGDRPGRACRRNPGDGRMKRACVQPRGGAGAYGTRDPKRAACIGSPGGVLPRVRFDIREVTGDAACADPYTAARTREAWVPEPRTPPAAIDRSGTADSTGGGLPWAVAAPAAEIARGCRTGAAPARSAPQIVALQTGGAGAGW